MLARGVHKLMTASLIAVILFGSLLSPAVHHAHVGGGVPHSHAADLAVHDASHEQHKHSHGGHTHTHHGRDASRVSPQGHLADDAAHLHIALLWFDFTLPLESNPGEAPLPVGEESLVVLRLTPDAVCSVAHVVVDLVDQWSAAAAPAESGGAEGLWAAKPRQGGADRNLLCDSARGARSGVLLI
jgi:hypothetical protein